MAEISAPFNPRVGDYGGGSPEARNQGFESKSGISGTDGKGDYILEFEKGDFLDGPGRTELLGLVIFLAIVVILMFMFLDDLVLQISMTAGLIAVVSLFGWTFYKYKTGIKRYVGKI